MLNSLNKLPDAYLLKEAFNAFCYKLSNIGFKPYMIHLRKADIEFPFLVGDAKAARWYDRSRWSLERQKAAKHPTFEEVRFIKDHLLTGNETIFECGAHHGSIVVPLSILLGKKGKIVAFEPFSDNFKILKKNIDLNKLDNVQAINKAAGSNEEEVYLTNDSNSSVSVHRNGIPSKMTCLDNYAHLKPTLLKIDVEGYEVEVLRGAKEILRRKPKLAIEIHPKQLAKYKASVKELLDLLDLSNYTSWIYQEGFTAKPIQYDNSIQIKNRTNLFAIPN